MIPPAAQPLPADLVLIMIGIVVVAAVGIGWTFCHLDEGDLDPAEADRPRRRSRWAWPWKIWREESTRRGVARVITALFALWAARHSPELAAVIVAIGQLIAGLLGATRSDE